MQEMSDLNHEGETLLYPRMVITDCCPTAELAERIAANSTFSPGEAAGLIRQLADEMAAVMASGRSVRLDGIGTFTPTLALEHDKKREAPDGSGSRRNATSIRVGGVGFRVNRRLVSETDRLCHLERAACNFVRQRSPYTPEERLTRALTYLADHPWLTVADYAQLCRLSRTTAGRELRRWLADPLLASPPKAAVRTASTSAAPPKPTDNEPIPDQAREPGTVRHRSNMNVTQRRDNATASTSRKRTEHDECTGALASSAI